MPQIFQPSQFPRKSHRNYKNSSTLNSPKKVSPIIRFSHENQPHLLHSRRFWSSPRLRVPRKGPAEMLGLKNREMHASKIRDIHKNTQKWFILVGNGSDVRAPSLEKSLEQHGTTSWKLRDIFKKYHLCATFCSLEKMDIALWSFVSHCCLTTQDLHSFTWPLTYTHLWLGLPRSRLLEPSGSTGCDSCRVFYPIHCRVSVSTSFPCFWTSKLWRLGGS